MICQKTAAKQAPQSPLPHFDNKATPATVSFVGTHSAVPPSLVVIDTPLGLTDDFWTPALPKTTISWGPAPWPIMCEFGPSRGKKSNPKFDCLTLLPEGRPNYFSSSGPTRGSVLTFSKLLMTKVADDMGIHGFDPNFLRDDLIFFRDQTLHALLEAYRLRSTANLVPLMHSEIESFESLIVERIIKKYHLQRPIVTSGRISPHKLKLLYDYIEAHLADDISIDELAALAEFGYAHFIRAFHRSCGVPPHRYIMERRVARAKTRLLIGNENIAEIARGCGYARQEHFSVVFKKVTGVTPRQFRQDCAA